MIIRNPEAAAQKDYDLIVVGGGVYGAMLTLEASLRGRSVLVLEKEDFGGATSYNSLRIIHGGLRYLQTLNFKRYREFVRERRWFLEYFPDLVQPLPVLMPLYQHGLRRTSTFRIAFLLDRFLSHRRNQGWPAERALPHGRVISTPEVKQRCPAVYAQHLKGGALWVDACVPDSQRLIIEVLRCACSMGATALNYTAAVDLLEERNQVVGVRARDALHDTHYDFSSGVVINATGPWSRENARSFDQDLPDLFRYSIAWNILFDREALSAYALGVAPPGPRGRLYFLPPWKGRLLVGTGHAPRTTRHDDPQPTPKEIHRFLDDVNAAIPSLNLKPQDILHIFTGFIPVKEEGTLRFVQKDCLIDHAKHHGPAGLFSVGGTKFTASRSAAEAILERIFPECRVMASRAAAFRKARTEQTVDKGIFDYQWFPNGTESTWCEPLREIIEEEAVCHLDDLILRRTTLGDNPIRALTLAPVLCNLFDWDARRRKEEIRRLELHFRWVQNADEP